MSAWLLLVPVGVLAGFLAFVWHRLAVAPGHQGQGHGRALAIDALVWMRSRRLTQGLVNTAVTNRPALGLYESLGFERLPDRLVVMQFELSPER